MSKENNLTDFLTDVADAIREKKGTTEKINPQDFATEIANISSVEETSNIEYLDVSGVSDGRFKLSLLLYCMYIKCFMEPLNSYMTGVPYVQYAMTGEDIENISQIAIALKDEAKLSMDGTIMSITFEQDVKQNAGVTQEQLDAIPRITKEEFYSLD